MKNYMKDIANMLGVEIGEPFKVDNGFTYMFTEKGIVAPSCVYRGVYTSEDLEEKHYELVLLALLNGDLTILPKPWKPTYDERYYSIGPGGVLEPGNWLNDFIDQAMYKLGNCYRTPQEAEENRDKWIKFYSSDELIEL